MEPCIESSTNPQQKPQQLYILGHPISHSKSPAMYRALYGEMGLPWSYDFMDLPEETDAEAFLAERNFLSINITTPYKPNAFAAADVQAPAACLANGANVLVNHEGQIIAYNTDGEGCVVNLERLGFDFDGKNVVVCGTGPTAQAIYHACAAAGATQMTMLGRNAERVNAVVDDYVEQLADLEMKSAAVPLAGTKRRSLTEILDGTNFGSGTYDMCAMLIPEADLIIDATPLGMKPGDPAPFDTTLLHEGQWVFDAVYGHGETALVAGAKAAGARALDGSGMLVAQAVATAQIVLDYQQVKTDLTTAQMFAIMAAGAGLEC